uniref:Reverse transcriptase domain-containing protein n=1 Tax=Astyanax mexicanus TaxID=7994 RepID=A0A8B9J9W2_ASTMX
FQQFYTQLYSSESQSDHNRHIEYLSKLNLSHLSKEDAEQLGKPIQLNELKEALQLMQKGKAPGIDGIPPEFYLTFFSQLGPLLLDMINTAIEAGSFQRDTNTALISVLLKPEKDPLSCNSYRPLSLIGSDTKLFAKVLAMRLESHMTKLVHFDQTGFIKNRLATDNVRRLLHVLDLVTDLTTPCAVVSLDAEKAFDRLKWTFLWAVLEFMGVGEKFINMIKTLYASPSAKVITGNNCSQPFPISRGSRQGCPLSPLLFCLSLEALAQAIRLSPLYSPITIKDTRHHISLYADDILLYLSNAPQTLPHLFDILDTFSTHSGYKVNKNKSVLLSLNNAMLDSNILSPIPVVKNLGTLG